MGQARMFGHTHTLVVKNNFLKSQCDRMAAREAELMRQIKQLTRENTRLHTLIFECAESVIAETLTPCIATIVENKRDSTTVHTRAVLHHDL